MSRCDTPRSCIAVKAPAISPQSPTNWARRLRQGVFLQRLSERHDQPRRVRIGGGARNAVVEQRNDARNVGAAFDSKDLALETSVRLLVVP